MKEKVLKPMIERAVKVADPGTFEFCAYLANKVVAECLKSVDSAEDRAMIMNYFFVENEDD
jgi:hypothetical protein